MPQHHPARSSAPHVYGDVLFQAKYGALPKYVPYVLIPFLLVVTGFLFVHAVVFGQGITIKSVTFSARTVATVICPVISLLCTAILVADLYRRIHPQFVVITTEGLFLPKGRYTDEIVHICWGDLEATRYAGRIAVFDIYEITCRDSRHGTKAMIASVLFRDFDDFADFALIVGDHMRVDWSVKGFLPGTIRGKQNKTADVVPTKTRPTRKRGPNLG